jgi:antitoxin (DNA-binding transcriptional repressor) of toxin-antitoxin stability system
MKTATLRDLRNHFHKLEAWLEEGESVEISRRGQPVAVLTRPSVLPVPAAFQMPDFAARREKHLRQPPLSRRQLEAINEHDLLGQQG